MYAIRSYYALAAQQEPDAVHRDRVARALELIRDGHVYQVNLARRFALAVDGHPFALAERMLRVAEPPLGHGELRNNFV